MIKREVEAEQTKKIRVQIKSHPIGKKKEVDPFKCMKYMDNFI